MRRLGQWLALCCACGFAAPATASLTTLTDLFVFGDSLSDAGNSGVQTQLAAGVTFPPPPYVGGRYSNGQVAVEYLWNLYNPGIPFAPSLAGGTNFAIGGATTGTVNFNTVNPLVPMPLRPAFSNRGAAWQLQQFTSTVPPGFDPASSLFVVWLMPNDVFYLLQTGGLSSGVVPGSPGGPDVVSNALANIGTIIGTLAGAGARHFLVPNMPDLALTPAFRGSALLAPLLSGLTNAFNDNLALLLDFLDASLPIEIVQFDTAASFEELVGNPGAFGFTNVTESCVANLMNGRCNPDTWLFWDTAHPTTRAHEILGLQFAQAVSEPATLVLVGLALGALALGRRRVGLFAQKRS
jgi:phospholipase/lecithinase/hemolysin